MNSFTILTCNHLMDTSFLMALGSLALFELYHWIATKLLSGFHPYDWAGDDIRWVSVDMYLLPGSRRQWCYLCYLVLSGSNLTKPLVRFDPDRKASKNDCIEPKIHGLLIRNTPGILEIVSARKTSWNPAGVESVYWKPTDISPGSLEWVKIRK